MTTTATTDKNTMTMTSNNETNTTTGNMTTTTDKNETAPTTDTPPTDTDMTVVAPTVFPISRRMACLGGFSALWTGIAHHNAYCIAASCSGAPLTFCLARCTLPDAASDGIGTDAINSV